MALQTIAHIVILLIIASLLYKLAQYLKTPYTILLFIVGALIGGINTLLPSSRQLVFDLTPELLFYVFLPVLIFESGYSIKYFALRKQYLPIWSLAIVGLLISIGIIFGISYGLDSWIGLGISWQVLLLFAVIISSTDPVAVLSIAKELGLPKRLRLILEGESLFNDATTVALFFVCIELIRQGVSWSSIGSGGIIFVQSIVFGIILGIGFGLGCAYFLKRFKNDTYTEITITLILAHLTFLTAEYITQHSFFGLHIHVSGIIATAFAGIIMGNFGKTKISPKVELLMEEFRGFFAFVVNSILFLAIGMYVPKILDLPGSYLWFGLLLSLITIIARLIAVYGILGILQNFMKEKFPKARLFVISRGGLRGALALVLVLLIPSSLELGVGVGSLYPIFLLLSFVIIGIFVSLVVQGLSMKYVIHTVALDGFKRYEEFELLEAEVVVYNRMLEKLENMKLNYTMSYQTYELLRQKYRGKLDESISKTQHFVHTHEDGEQIVSIALRLHALGIEKSYLYQMYHYNELPENIYHYLLNKIELQIERVKGGKSQIRGFGKGLTTRPTRDPIVWIINTMHHTDHCHHDDYILNRARMILSQKVISSLQSHFALDFGYDNKRGADIIDVYSRFYEHALSEVQFLEQQDSEIAGIIETALLNKGLAKHEELVVKELYHHDMITEKIYNMFLKEIDEEVWKIY